MDRKPGLFTVIYGLLQTLKDIVYEIKALRKKTSELDETKINLATSGVVICPQCGAAFRDNLSKCDYCGYVSEERDVMLEKIRASKRGLEAQIRQQQGDLKKLLLIPLFIAIPFFIGIMAFLSVELIGFTLFKLEPLIIEFFETMK